MRFLKARWPRLAWPVAAALAVAVPLPVLQPLDSAAFLTVNGLGDGPELVGTVVGWQTGLFCAGLVASTGLLPAVTAAPREVARPPTAAAQEQSA